MKPPRDYRDYLHDLLDASEKVAEFIRGMTQSQFLEDEKTQFAVVRGLEIIGEAASRARKHGCRFEGAHNQR